MLFLSGWSTKQHPSSRRDNRGRKGQPVFIGPETPDSWRRVRRSWWNYCSICGTNGMTWVNLRYGMSSVWDRSHILRAVRREMCIFPNLNRPWAYICRYVRVWNNPILSQLISPHQQAKNARDILKFKYYKGVASDETMQKLLGNDKALTPNRIPYYITSSTDKPGRWMSIIIN